MTELQKYKSAVLQYKALLSEVSDIICMYPSSDTFKPVQTAAYIHRELSKIEKEFI